MAPGTKTPEDVRPPPTELVDSMALLEERARQISALGEQAKQQPSQQQQQKPSQQQQEDAGEVPGFADFDEGAKAAMAGDWALAMKRFAAASEANGEVPAFWYYRGFAAHRLGKNQAAIDSVRRAIRAGGHEGAPELLERLDMERLAELAVGARRAGDAALEAEQYADAVTMYGEAIGAVGARAPALRASCHHGRGVSRAMLDEWGPALSDWEQAVECCAALSAELASAQPVSMYQHYRGLALKQATTQAILAAA